MSKPFKTFTDQIKILRGRKLIIADTVETRRVLCKENYYYVINGYKDIFLDKTATVDEIFEDQIKKDEIIHENLIYATDKAMSEFQSDTLTEINKLY